MIVGSPAGVISPLREVVALVLADVATLHHVRNAVAAGAGGLVPLSAGVGGQTGWVNPFALVGAVFTAATESMAGADYREMLVASPGAGGSWTSPAHRSALGSAG
jgi:hypothetical protein